MARDDFYAVFLFTATAPLIAPPKSDELDQQARPEEEYSRWVDLWTPSTHDELVGPPTPHLHVSE